MKKIVSIILITLLGLFFIPIKSNALNEELNIKQNVFANNTNYTSTLKEWEDSGLSDDLDEFQVITPSDFIFNNGELLSNTNSYGLFLDENDLEVSNTDFVFDFSNADEISANIQVEQGGLYSLAIDYYSQNKSVRDMEVSVLINDSIQYYESGQITLKNNWESTHDFNVDRYGNDIMPTASIKEMWVHNDIIDSHRVQPEALKFHLQEGNNTIKIKRIRGEFILGQIYVSSRKDDLSYQEYLNKYQGEVVNKELLFEVEAENPIYKNDLSIRYGTDKATTVTPFALSENKLNILDGGSFRVSGHKVTYDVTVASAGFYYITLKTKQQKNFSRVFRTLYVNGVVPFKEAKDLPFDYSSKWTNDTLKVEDENLKIFLNAGKNNISLEVNSSPLLGVYEKVDYVMQEINDLGLDIKKLTGNDTDSSIDWEIDENIPKIKEDLLAYATVLDNAYEELVEINQTKKNSEILINIKRASDSLHYFSKYPNRIPKEITKFSVGNSSTLQKLGLILPLILDQPLSVDKIYVHGQDVTLPKPRANFFYNIWIGLKRFVLSFFSNQFDDRLQPGELEIWVNKSRQYVNLMQQMVDDSFTKETGIRVKISIMPNEDKLILATSSNTQPDLALGVAGWRPYDFAIRNAVVDLREMPDFFEVAERFQPGAFAQLIYQDGVYGLPETQNFSLLFYRKDILDSINVDIPDTWQDVLDILPELQRYGMNFFSPLSSSNAFKAYINTMPFINQFGGTLYTEDMLKSNLTDQNTINALDFMTELYTIYSLPLEVGSFYNQFRYGTLPIGIGDFGMYVQLLHAAPEIAGLWELAPMPGVLKDGVVDRSYDGAGTSGMIFENSDKQLEAWDFLKWWTSKEVQLQYSENLMTSMGTEYMWNTSNIEAFKEVSWDESHKDVFLEQWEWIFDTPKTPASYMMEREISNIWNTIVYDGVNTRIAISDSSIIIDKEITKKMLEFNYIDNQNNIVKHYRFPTRETIEEWVRE